MSALRRFLDGLMRCRDSLLRLAAQPQRPGKRSPRPHPVVVSEGEVNFVDAGFCCNLEAALAMTLRSGLISGELLRHANHPFGERTSCRIACFGRNIDAALRHRYCPMKLA